MKQITKLRKTVCIIANELKKMGYSLSQAFKKAWQQVKSPMVIRAAGTTFENRQERIKFLKSFHHDDLTITLEREPSNQIDSNAIQIVVHIKSISRKTVIGYVPKETARGISKVIDMGIQVNASLMQFIGGYRYKESLGVLICVGI